MPSCSIEHRLNLPRTQTRPAQNISSLPKYSTSNQPSPYSHTLIITIYSSPPSPQRKKKICSTNSTAPSCAIPPVEEGRHKQTELKRKETDAKVIPSREPGTEDLPRENLRKQRLIRNRPSASRRGGAPMFCCRLCCYPLMMGKGKKGFRRGAKEIYGMCGGLADGGRRG